jgi:hypothetical protein
MSLAATDPSYVRTAGDEIIAMDDLCSGTFYMFPMYTRLDSGDKIPFL